MLDIKKEQNSVKLKEKNNKDDNIHLNTSDEWTLNINKHRVLTPFIFKAIIESLCLSHTRKYSELEPQAKKIEDDL